jgi:cephalosporin hydroxylase
VRRFLRAVLRRLVVALVLPIVRWLSICDGVVGEAFGQRLLELMRVPSPLASASGTPPRASGNDHWLGEGAVTFREVPGGLEEARKGYRSRFATRLSQWLLYHQKELVADRCSWMGVTMLKNPLDSWIYQEILFEVRPDILIEIGSWDGGSTLYFAHLMDLMGRGEVLSVDIDRSRFRVKHERIRTLTGSSISPEVLRGVAEACSGKSVLIIHDADHSKEAVLADLEAYAPLVSLGSYFVVEDGIIDIFEPDDVLGRANGGPLAAVEEFLLQRKDFVVDAKRERYLLTYNPRGFLKRIT